MENGIYVGPVSDGETAVIKFITTEEFESVINQGPNMFVIGEPGEGRGFYMGAEMKGQIDEKDVIECAKKLLKNTNPNIPYLGEILDDVITNGESRSEDDAYLVIEKIAKDGYDISDFALIEVPHTCVYCFGNWSQKQFFDVYLDHFNDGEEYSTVGFVGDDACTHDANSIKEAILKFCHD